MLRLTTLTLALFVLGLSACQSVSSRNTQSSLPTPVINPGHYSPSASDDALLDHIQRQTALYFVETAHPETAMVSDRAAADGTAPGDVASVAAQGFAYSVWCLAAERGWLSRDVARERTLTSLRFLRHRVEGKEGFFYHFVHRRTGRRANDCELSSIDTALMLAGALTARVYFNADTPDEREIRDLATELYAAVNWPWMTDNADTLRLGWTPEHGFLEERWDTYSELMLMQLLALASPTHPLPPESWHAWKRVPVITFGGRTFLACPPLFTHQYPQAWFDLRHQHDDYADYFHNSRLATLAQRQMVQDFAGDFPHYTPSLWGLTASDGPDKYVAWGGPPSLIKPPLDGIVVPCAPGGSVPFAPQACTKVLRNLRNNHTQATWTRYGFVDAFNPATGWVSHDVLAIDAGITVMAIENHRTGFFWSTFMRDPDAQRALQIAGFKPNAPDRATTHANISLNALEKRPPDLRRLTAPTAVAVAAGPNTKRQWTTLPIEPKAETAAGTNSDPLNRPDTELSFAFTWDDQALYFEGRVRDSELRNGFSNELLYKGDCIELFIDPQNDGLRWMNPADFQFGFAPDPQADPNDNSGKYHEWFGNGHRIIPHRVDRTTHGYTVTAGIPWRTLGISNPGPGTTLGISPAVRDLRDAMPWLKSEWFLNSRGESIELGQLILE